MANATGIHIIANAVSIKNFLSPFFIRDVSQSVSCEPAVLCIRGSKKKKTGCVAGWRRSNRRKDRMQMSSHQRVLIHVADVKNLTDYLIFVNHQPPFDRRFAGMNRTCSRSRPPEGCTHLYVHRQGHAFRQHGCAKRQALFSIIAVRPE